MLDNPFKRLTAVVRYRQKGCSDPWCNIAAFDLLLFAERYADECNRKSVTWEYEAIEVPASDETTNPTTN